METATFPLWEITRVVFGLLPAMVIRPGQSLMFWLVVGLVAFQYRRLAAMETTMYGRTGIRPWLGTFQAIFHGVLGGVLASYLLILTGVALGPRDVLVLWPVALVLMLIHPRFLCFSYAATVVVLSHLLVGWPDIHAPGIIGLVAVLHVTEGVLVWIGGDRTALPVFVRQRTGAVVGGFHLQRFWPVPLVALLVMELPQGLQGEVIPMPDWWPLVQAPDALLSAEGWTLTLWPVAAALGYADIAVRRDPASRSRRAAHHLILYSVTLLLLAVAASHWPPLLWVAALASGGLHEWMIRAGLRSELEGSPHYARPPKGVGILEVFPGSEAEAMGLRRGDVILAADGVSVEDRRALEDRLVTAPQRIELTVRRGSDLFRFVHERRSGSGVPAGNWGIVPIPEAGDRAHVDPAAALPWKRRWERWRRRGGLRLPWR